jgi:uncharacterized protein (DUF2267 family)
VAALRSYVSAGELADVQSQLPDEYGELLGTENVVH